MKKETLYIDSIARGANFDKDVQYMIPYDLGVTFGTIYSNFSKWIKRDLEGCVKFNSDYIKTQITSDKRFIWNKGVLAQARKPVLALQCTIDHANASEIFTHPANKNWEAIHFLEPTEFTHRMISIEDNLDKSNNIEFRYATKSIRMELSAGIAVGSRFEAENIANYWMTKRSTNWYYEFPQIIDFKIPDEVIYIIADKFKLDINNHHILLKYLNANSHSHIYYAMDGYNGKYYYFMRYNANPLIHVEDLSNPTEYEVDGFDKGNHYAILRTFSMEIMIPSIISIAKYGDRLKLDDIKNKILSGVHKDTISRAHTDIYERYVEIEKVFDRKHAYKEMLISYTKDDLITHKDGTTTTKKIDIKDLVFNDSEGNTKDKYLTQLVEWAKNKGYKYTDIFNIQMYKMNNDLRKWKEEVLRNSINTDMPNIVIPPDNDEYKYYIKNISNLTIVDLAPELNCDYLIILYLDLIVKNQYEYEINPIGEMTTGNDDLGIELPYGPSNVDKGSKYF